MKNEGGQAGVRDVGGLWSLHIRFCVMIIERLEQTKSYFPESESESPFLSLYCYNEYDKVIFSPSCAGFWADVWRVREGDAQAG